MDVAGPSRAKKQRNTAYCCVPQCSSYAGSEISLHVFPKDVNLRRQWEIALKMGKPASDAMKVCSKHFLKTDFFPGGLKRHKLFPKIVPSQNLPVRSHDRVESSPQKKRKRDRMERALKNREIPSMNCSEESSVDQQDSLSQNSDDIPQIVVKPFMMTVSSQCNLIDTRRTRPADTRGLADILCELAQPPLQLVDKCTQVNSLPISCEEEPIKKSMTLPDMIVTEENLFTFTGVHSFELLEGVVSCVEELSVDSSTSKKMLSVKDRTILTLVKIKLNMQFTALGPLFGISRQTCSNYFKHMCPLLAAVLKSVIPWPDQEMIRSNLPISFNKYRHTRVVLDCAETVVEKCKCLKCRILTYSQYKKNHTIKFLVGVTPSGLITQIEMPYGGRASDQKVVDGTKVLDKCDYGDGVMADKGFKIDKQCDERYLKLIRPPFFKKKDVHQLSREDALETADIARARVHVERVIQRLRQYELVAGPVPWTIAPYFEDTLIIVAGLTNLGPPVMSVDKFM